MRKRIDVIYEDGVFKPLERVEFKKGQRLRVEIIENIFGLLKDWEIDAQKLKDELRKIHG